MTANAIAKPLDLPRALRPNERAQLRRSLEGQLALAKEKGRWRAYRDTVFCLVLLGAGPRVSATCSLRRADVHLGRGQRYLQVRRAKGGKPRKVRVPAELAQILRDYMAGFPADDEAPLFPGTLRAMRPMSRQTGWRRWKKALAAVGLDMQGRGCHAARHGLGLQLWKDKKDLRLVAAQLGPADLRSTMVYTQPLPEDVDEALDATW